MLNSYNVYLFNLMIFVNCIFVNFTRLFIVFPAIREDMTLVQLQSQYNNSSSAVPREEGVVCQGSIVCVLG